MNDIARSFTRVHQQLNITQVYMNARRIKFIDISAAQLIRKFTLAMVIIVGAAFAAISDSIWDSHSIGRELVEFLGLLMIVACIVARIFCSLYIGGRKISSLVIAGPYSVCRNPLYAASIIGAVGIGAQQGSIALGAIGLANIDSQLISSI